MSEQNRAAALYNQAISHPRGSSLRASLLHAAVQVHPRFGAAYLSLGADERRSSSAGLDAAARALPLLQIAASLIPTHAAATYSYGEALLTSGRHEEAIEYLRAARDTSPMDAQYEYWHGLSLLKTYQLQAASASLHRAVVLDPSHAILTARNDGGASPADRLRVASRNAQGWADLARTAESTDVVTEHEMMAAHKTEVQSQASSVALEWTLEEHTTEAGGERTDAAAGSGVTAPRTHRKRCPRRRRCTVAEASSPQALADALDAAFRIGTPVLLRNATVGWPAAQDGAAAIVEALHSSSASHRGLLPVSIVHPSEASTNRVHPLDESRLTPTVQEHLRAKAVGHVLQRPLTQWMRPSTLASLMSERNGICASRCYVKQLRLDLFLPAMLPLLRPPRLADLPLAEANLWLGSTRPSRPLRSEVHKDDRPNLLANLGGGLKQVLIVPPSDAWRLRPQAMLDVMSQSPMASTAVRSSGSNSGDGSSSRSSPAGLNAETGSSARSGDESAPALLPGEPLLPTKVGAVVLDRQHYLAAMEELLRDGLRPVNSTAAEAAGCSSSLDPTPPRQHATEAQPTADRDTDENASDNTNRQERMGTDGACSFTLGPHDAIFIPPRYAHAVETWSDLRNAESAVHARSSPEQLSGHSWPFTAAVNLFYG